MRFPIPTPFPRLWLLLAIAGTLLALAALSLNPGAASSQDGPSVTGVAVTSAPKANNTYTLGEIIRVTLTFSEAVEVSGTPRLKIDMDPAHWGQKWALYESGSGTSSLIFAHVVVEPNTSTQGIAVLANTLTLNGGAIKSTATEADADLSHTGLGHDPNHKVDWQANRTATGAPTITGTARVGETLASDTSDISDDDGLSSATFNYQWLADDADISGATGSSYTLSDAEKGKAVKVRVSFTDDSGHAESLTSAATAAVTPPPLTASFEGVPTEHDGRSLFSFELHFSENFPGRMSWKKLRDEAFQVENGRVRKAARVVKGENRRWSLSVRPDSSEDVVITLPATTDCSAAGAVCTDAGRALSNTTTVTVPGPVENTPATGAPTITGTAQVGETLTSDTSGISDDDGLVNATFSYQWLADDADISGATGSAYTLADADEGKAIKVRVSFTDDAGNDEALTSAATAAVSGRPPEPLTVSLENEPTSHDGSGSFTFDLRFSEEVKLSYKNLRDHGFTVTGGTVTKAERLDKPSNIRWRITVKPDSTADVTVVLPITTDCDAPGAVCTEAGSALSNTISVAVLGPVENNPATGTPTITGTVQVGETLTADTSGISDDDGLNDATFSYQWLADDADISGATGDTYTLADANEGKAVKVRVSFTDDAGNDETLTSAATTAVEPAPQPVQRSVGQGYKGQLAEVLVELSLRGLASSSGSAAATRSDGTSGQSSHTNSIVYVIDDSGSMDGDFPEVRAALRAVRDATMANTKVALVAFGTDHKQLFGLSDHSATPSPWTDAHIDSFGGKLGGTYENAALESAKALLDADTTATSKKIIFLTDAEISERAPAFQAIDDAGIIVDAIVFSNHYSLNEDVLQEIAEHTGGTFRTVLKPPQGTTNTPAVTAMAMPDILKGAVADNTATLFLVDHSFSVYEPNETFLHPALNAAAAKAGDSSGTGRQVGLAEFLGENALYANPPQNYEADEFSKYQVVNAIGSSSLSMADGIIFSTGSTDIEHALSQAYSTITDTSVTATNKRVVLISDGISATEVPGAGTEGSALKKYKDDGTVTLDVVAWGLHADRVQLKSWADSASGTFSVAKAGPAPPRSFKARPGHKTLALSWANPNDPSITKYQYRVVERSEITGGRPDDVLLSSDWTDIPGSGASTTMHIFTELSTDGLIVQIRGMYGDDPGAPSYAYGPMIVGASRFSIGLTATAGDGEIALNWNDRGDPDVSSYQYAWREGDEGPWSNWIDIPGSDGSTTSHTVTGLTNGTAYTIAVLPMVEGHKINVHMDAVTATPTS